MKDHEQIISIVSADRWFAVIETPKDSSGKSFVLNECPIAFFAVTNLRSGIAMCNIEGGEIVPCSEIPGFQHIDRYDY